MKNLTEIATIVKDYLDDTTITVDQHIIDSVHFLSNIFEIRTIDISQSTVFAAKTLDLPTLNIKVHKVLIGTTIINELKNLDDLKYNLDNSLNKWYIAGSKIQFTVAHSAISATEIHYDKGFIEPESAVDTDVPSRYLELVYIGAVYRYYHKIVSKVILNREDYPDVKPNEIKQIRNTWKDQYFELIKEIKKDAKSL